MRSVSANRVEFIAGTGLLKDAKAYAKKHGLSLSDVCRMAVRQYLQISKSVKG